MTYSPRESITAWQWSRSFWTSRRREFSSSCLAHCNAALSSSRWSRKRLSQKSAFSQLKRKRSQRLRSGLYGLWKIIETFRPSMTSVVTRALCGRALSHCQRTSESRIGFDRRHLHKSPVCRTKSIIVLALIFSFGGTAVMENRLLGVNATINIAFLSANDLRTT